MHKFASLLVSITRKNPKQNNKKDVPSIKTLSLRLQIDH